jgi:hypothetical protein
MPGKIINVFVVIIAALSFILGSCIAPNSSKDGDRHVNDTIVPPIDRTVPAVVKTATFSVG